MAAKRRYRKLFKFWLNEFDGVEKALVRVASELKARGAFTETIRDGLKLIWDLRYMNSTDMLLELFPDIRERLGVPPPPDNSDLIEEFRQMLRAEIKVIPVAQPVSGGIQEMVVPKLSAPVFEDDDVISVQKDDGAGTVSSTNFLDAAFGFQDVEVDLSADDRHE